VESNAAVRPEPSRLMRHAWGWNCGDEQMRNDRRPGGGRFRRFLTWSSAPRNSARGDARPAFPVPDRIRTGGNADAPMDLTGQPQLMVRQLCLGRVLPHFRGLPAHVCAGAKSCDGPGRLPAGDRGAYGDRTTASPLRA